MIRRSIFVGLALVGLLTTPAMAAEVPHGRGPTAQALLDAATLGSGNEPVQILNELCENPTRQRHCSAISWPLTKALEQAIDRPFRWVSERDRHGPRFVVFAPVSFSADQATTELAWRDPGVFGCFGGTRLDWELDHGGWHETSGVAWAGCPAT